MRMQRARKSRGALREGVHYDHAAAVRKRTEVVAAVHQILSKHFDLTSDATAESLVDHFIIVSPPEASSNPEPKPGHVELNLTKLVTAVRDGTLTLPNAIVPWTTLLGALAVWEILWLTNPQLDATEVDATVLWTLWITRDSRDMVSKNSIVTAVNAETTTRNRPALTPAQIESALLKLRRLKCIETARSAVNSFWLRGCVQMQYS
jgi:hypothetical protein